jgi:hypothetical protein
MGPAQALRPIYDAVARRQTRWVCCVACPRAYPLVSRPLCLPAYLQSGPLVAHRTRRAYLCVVHPGAQTAWMDHLHQTWGALASPARLAQLLRPPRRV